MLEDIESKETSTGTLEDTRMSLTSEQADYINECIEADNPYALVDRIDEMSTYNPPKAIDSDSEVAEIIEPIKDSIESKYLEAPSDLEQIKQLGDYLADVPEFRYDVWKELNIDERYKALQLAEFKIAEIEHRDPCTMRIESLGEGYYGYYRPIDKSITLNVDYLMSNSLEDYKNTLDTLIHEGRHAYQDYNMNDREVHPREGEVNMWKWNENTIGYKDAFLCGMEAYAMQPVETDARAFAEDVLKTFLNNIA
ncbi:MAG: hypothetical protein K2J63_05145 [Muribaculaceae bacterium]|nr:hypothetical protein [Muribaculaceae bacterium]